jgi:uncharacterized iron-regulated membrane protein
VTRGLVVALHRWLGLLGTAFLSANLKRPAHTGDIFGAPTRALYFIVSVAMGDPDLVEHRS